MTTQSISHRARALILTFLFFSGFSGLVYEVVWMKMLILVMGNTVLSITTVLTAFMGGLSLGSFLGGRLEDRLKNPLKVYGILEAGIGIFALLMPLLIAGANPLFRFVYQTFESSIPVSSAVRFSICCLLLLVPTTLMGATLPVLCRYFVRQKTASGWTVGVLYGVNTLGAALGALAAGFVLLPRLGVTWTVITTASLNIAIAAGTLTFRRLAVLPELGSPPDDVEPQATSGTLSKHTLVVLVGVGLSGLAAMVYQIAWTRALSLSIGSSVYAFSLILSAFICGLALGSLLIPRFIDQRRDQTFKLALVLGLLALTGVLTTLVLGIFPVLVVEFVSGFVRSFAALQLAQLGSIFVLLIVPTFLMGTVIPIATAICATDSHRLGRFFGNTYSVNTIGAILGSMLGGFVFVPLLGMRNSILLAASLNVVAAGVMLPSIATTLSRFKRAAGLFLLLALVGLAWKTVPRWDPLVLTSAPYLYADLYRNLATKKDQAVSAVMTEGRQLLFFEEGRNALVSVKKTAQGDLALEINGKTDATARGDAATQLLAAHLPLMLHGESERVLVIGFGSGMSLGAAQRHPVRQIDIVELEAAVVRASELFTDFTGHSIQDERVDLRLTDGRIHLALSGRSYDVIISEPTNIWISGVSNLFTREFFELAKQQLGEDGIICQWLQAYSMSDSDFKTVVRTFVGVFPHAQLWEADLGNDYLLLGSPAEINLNMERLDSRLRSPIVMPDMVRMNVAGDSALIAKLLMTRETLAEYAGGGPINTDDNTLLEYSAPKALAHTRSVPLLQEIYGHRTPPERLLSPLGVDDSSHTSKGLTETFRTRAEVVSGFISYVQRNDREAVEAFGRALALSPSDYDATYLLARLHHERGQQAESALRPDDAELAYRQATRVIDQFTGYDRVKLSGHFDLAAVHAEADLHLGVILLNAGRLEEATRAFIASLSAGVRLVQAHNNLGVIYERTERYEDAAREYRLALETNPNHAPARMNLGNIYLKQKEFAKAIECYQLALRQKPNEPVMRFNLGVAYFQQEAWDDASREWSRALELDPKMSEARNGLALVREKRGEP